VARNFFEHSGFRLTVTVATPPNFYVGATWLRIFVLPYELVKSTNVHLEVEATAHAMDMTHSSLISF
jgi:hypothetical protein